MCNYLMNRLTSITSPFKPHYSSFPDFRDPNTNRQNELMYDGLLELTLPSNSLSLLIDPYVRTDQSQFLYARSQIGFASFLQLSYSALFNASSTFFRLRSPYSSMHLLIF